MKKHLGKPIGPRKKKGKKEENQLLYQERLIIENDGYGRVEKNKRLEGKFWTGKNFNKSRSNKY